MTLFNKAATMTISPLNLPLAVTGTPTDQRCPKLNESSSVHARDHLRVLGQKRLRELEVSSDESQSQGPSRKKSPRVCLNSGEGLNMRFSHLAINGQRNNSNERSHHTRVLSWLNNKGVYEVSRQQPPGHPPHGPFSPNGCSGNTH